MSTDAGPAPAVPKVDPETLAIRARPARAIRFRRGVIIAGAAGASAMVMGVAWMALQPQIFRRVAQESELSKPDSRPPNDALGGLPASYGDAPKLGPPLPGDLGRPILRAQQRDMATESGAGTVAGAPADATRTERERRAAEIKAARESGLLVQTSGHRSSSAPVAEASVAPALAAAASPVTPSEPNRKEAFVATIDRRGDMNPHMLSRPVSANMLMAGSVISASLITGLNSDLPGLVTAQVTQNAYDSVTGNILLVPQGARLIGRYDHVVAFGQQRALVIWERLILPDGASIRLDNMPATDPSGYAGLADKVDFHTWRLLKGVAMATLLGVGTELTVSGESDLVEAIRESAQTNTSRAGDRITQRNLDIPPTITIRPGAPVRLVVQKDLVLAPWRVGGQ